MKTLFDVLMGWKSMLELIEDCQNGSSLNAPYYGKSDDVGELPKESIASVRAHIGDNRATITMYVLGLIALTILIHECDRSGRLPCLRHVFSPLR